ncbi:hypothetical protein ACFJGX_03970 [Hydrogenophaga sp. UC242_50]|uniref:hypothetical protein n=1 Tax=unclassified Hydrogenophaga TaxID=2610897 RepID=UPI0036D26E59
MKTPFRVLLLCAVGLVGQQALAANVSATFNASVTLTSVCRVKTGSDNQTLNFGTYTAFQGGAQNAAGINIDFECTRGFAAAPTVAFDTGTDMTSTAAAATATGEGVVAGLRYTLAVAAGAITAGSAATTSSIGTADTYRYAVSGAMPPGQAGTHNPGLQTQARQLIITY